jgi:CubicO group peptidase (beta-lactamase class C family)
MSKKSTFLFSAVAILFITQSRLVTAQSDRVDSCIAAQMSNRHIPGLALAVIRNGVPVKVKGYGLANIELNVPVNPQTVFQSGSVGKQFTAMLVMLLVEQGKINLDEVISRYFPNSPTAWQKITVRHLLTHTSGIANYTEDSLGVNYQTDYTEDQMLKKAKQMPLDFQPGQKWSYSNTGYVLLGILIHKVTGQFYGDLLTQYIFQPLSMETTRIISEADIIPNRAAGYRLEKGELKNQEWVSPTFNTTADGSLYFTILDLIKWDAALSSGKILLKTSFDQIWSPVHLKGDSIHPYGFGWFLSPINGHKAVYHGGSWQGFNTYIARYVNDGLSVIVLTNLSPAIPGKIARSVASIYVPELAEKVLGAISDKEPGFKATVESLIAKPDTININYGLFTKDYVQKAKAFLKGNLEFLNLFGPVQSIEMIDYNQQNKNAITLQYRIRYKVGSRIATITRTKSDEISSFSSVSE